MRSGREPSAWVQFLYHPSFENEHQPEFTVSKASWNVVSNGFGVSHPLLWATRKGYTHQGEHKKRAMRMRAYGNEEFAASVLGDYFGVTQVEWPSKIQGAFGLKDPPTPYEVAWLLLGNGKLMRGSNLPSPWAKGALLWWLSGLSSRAMCSVIPKWEDEAAEAIRYLMENPYFALWALGTDLTPILTSRAKARALVDTRARHRAVRRELRQHYYVAALLRAGLRPKPVPRILPGPEPLWKDIDARKRWERVSVGAGGGWISRLARFREEARGILGPDFEVDDAR